MGDPYKKDHSDLQEGCVSIISNFIWDLVFQLLFELDDAPRLGYQEPDAVSLSLVLSIALEQ